VKVKEGPGPLPEFISHAGRSRRGGQLSRYAKIGRYESRGADSETGNGKQRATKAAIEVLN